jgi:hypothetical protein
MKVSPKIPDIPFSERLFTVEMTGMELAALKLLTGKCIGYLTTLRAITEKIYFSIDLDLPKKETIAQVIDFSNVRASDFEKELNRLNE